MGSGEDGAKNFYTVLYHITHDPGLSWFHGMNYPYGEHVVYTDNQPLVSNTLKILDAVFPVSENLHLLLPVLIFLSFLAGAWCLFLLVSKTGAPRWFSIPASVGIMLLSPSLIRIGGHYSLAYGVIIPLHFLLLFRVLGRNRPVDWLYVALWPFLAAFIHPYFLVMLSLSTACVMLADRLRMRQWPQWKWLLKVLALTLLPILFFQGIMALTDPVWDRPAAPYGFLVYRATWASVFLPLDFSYFRSLAHMGEQSVEGGYYVGVFALAGSIWMLFGRRGQNIPAPETVARVSRYSGTLLLASIPLLLLAVGFPFYVWKFHHLLEFTGPLQQFRGVGRFAFVFFFALNLFAAMSIGKRLAEPHHSRWQTSAAITLLFALALEAWSFSVQVRAVSGSGSTVFYDNPWTGKLAKEDLARFAAILPLPYFHVGSENFRTPDQPHIREQSFALSQHTSLPLFSVQMSRTSLSQTLHNLEMVCELTHTPYYLRQGLREKHILLLVDTKATLPAHQKKLVWAGTPLSSSGAFELYDLDLQSLAAIIEENTRNASIRQPAAILLDSAVVTREGVYFRSFDETDSGHVFRGGGSLALDRLDWTDLLPDTFYLPDSTDHELSFWFYAGDQHAVNTQVWLWEYEGQEEVRFEVTEVGDHVTAVEGEWILASLVLRPRKAGNRFRVTLHRDGKRQKIWVDEVLLRPVNADFCRPGQLNLNNRYYATEGDNPAVSAQAIN